jgi:hypothetical protein
MSSADFTGWFEDETLYSLAARYHRLSCNSHPATTLRALFGDAHKGFAHDLPARVNEFVHRVGDGFGTFEEIVWNRTILPVFMRFPHPTRLAELWEIVRNGSIGPLRASLGLLAGTFGARLPLKACAKCVRADVERFESAYWHRHHQLPGVWWCLDHDEPLAELVTFVRGAPNFGWYLPTAQATARAGQWASRLCGKRSQLARRLACDMKFLCDLPTGMAFEGAALHRTYAEGFNTKQGDVQNFSRFIADFSVLSDVERFANSAHTSARALKVIIRTPTSMLHPVPHLLAMLWMFGSAAHFWDRYQANVQSVENQGRYASRLRNSVCMDGSAGALLKAGAHCSKRHLTPQQRQTLLEAIGAGVCLKAAALAHGVSYATVCRLLQSSGDLSAVRDDAIKQSNRQKHRTQWAVIALSNPRTAITLLRLIFPATYRWLYRNDRGWLEEQAETRRLLRGSGLLTWDPDDRIIAARIRSISMEFSNRGTAMTFERLCLAHAELISSISRIDRLPLTQIALSETLQVPRTRDRSRTPKQRELPG